LFLYASSYVLIGASRTISDAFYCILYF